SLKRWMEIHGRGKFIAARLDSLDAPDNYTVKLALKQPTGVLPTFFSGNDVIIMPSDIAKAHPTAKDKLTQWVGTGPYRHLEHLPNRHVRYGGWDKYGGRDETSNGASGKRVAWIDELMFIPTPEA